MENNKGKSHVKWTFSLFFYLFLSKRTKKASQSEHCNEIITTFEHTKTKSFITNLQNNITNLN